jgi:UDP-glucose 4-epimerase
MEFLTNSKKALVIGGLGFIGANLVSRLKLNNFDVDITTSSKRLCDKNSSIYFISYNEQGFASLLTKNQYADIYFFSGNPSPSNSENDPYLDINLTNIPLLALLNSVVSSGSKARVWFASSVAVYGANNNNLSENANCLPLSYYAASKLMAEEHLKMFNRIYGIHTGVFRIFSTFGGGLKRQLVYDVWQKIKNNPKEIILYGSGNEARDLSYVEDQITAITCISENITPSGDIWNIGSGKLYSVSEIVSLICQIMGTQTKIKFQYPLRAYDGIKWRADISKIQALNFKQNYTLAEGLYETILSFENAN